MSALFLAEKEAEVNELLRMRRGRSGFVPLFGPESTSLQNEIYDVLEWISQSSNCVLLVSPVKSFSRSIVNVEFCNDRFLLAATTRGGLFLILHPAGLLQIATLD